MQNPESPESTGIYRCPACPNRERFIGYDDKGFPGDNCKCDQDPCTCEVTLAQPFEIINGIPVYDAFTGGGNNSEISEYTRIECAACGHEIYREEAVCAE